MYLYVQTNSLPNFSIILKQSRNCLRPYYIMFYNAKTLVTRPETQNVVFIKYLLICFH